MSKAKSLRLQAHYERQRAAHLAALRISTPSTEIPVPDSLPSRAPGYMKLGRTPERICRAYDVYLNGVRQVSCDEVSVEAGFVKRYPIGRGGLADRSKPLETLTGTVEIVHKGQLPTYGKLFKVQS